MGNLVVDYTLTYTSTSGGNSNGFYLTGNGTATPVDFAYVRAYNTNVVEKAKPPTTAQSLTGCIFQWKLDGDTTDACPGAYNGTGGAPTYLNPTPFQNLVVAIPQTVNHVAWDNWAPQRVGTTGQLDGSQSYSDIDASDAVTAVWSQTTGNALTFPDGLLVLQPHMSGFEGPGDMGYLGYVMHLVVTDLASNTASTDLTFGAVTMDSNGIVSSTNPLVRTILGYGQPFIAYGSNPWGREDERHWTAVKLAIQHLPTTYPKPWKVQNTSGTVSYPFTGIGPSPGQVGTTLTGSGITSSTATSFTIADESKLSMTSLPSWILVGNTLGIQELIRISTCTRIVGGGSCNGTTGAALLTVAYDGRGLASNPTNLIAGGGYGVIPAQAWAAGTVVGEMRIQGSGTSFSADATRPICPAGVPGPMGPVLYSTGTVMVSGSSGIINLSGGSWTQNANGMNPGNLVTTDGLGNIVGTYMIRIAATHGGGTPFIWWGTLTTWSSTTQMTSSRVLPSDVDAGPFAYKITGEDILYLDFAASDGPGLGTTHPQLIYVWGQGCESDTAAFAIGAHDITAYNTTNQTGQNYAHNFSFAPGGNQTVPAYYIPSRNCLYFFFRSGYYPALSQCSSYLAEVVLDPQFSGGISGGAYAAIYNFAPGAVDGLDDLVFNPSTTLVWGDVRGYGVWAEAETTLGCNGDDTRDTAIALQILGYLANYDPNSTTKATWNSAMGSALTRDQSCVRSDGSFANSAFTFYTPGGQGSAPVLTLTNGSTAVTGTAFTSDLCNGVSTGTITVTNGSAAFTQVSGTLSATQRIWINGTQSGGASRYTGAFEFSITGGTNPTQTGFLAGLWIGDSGTYSFMTEAVSSSLNTGMTTIGIDNTDDAIHNAMLSKNWACIYNSPTSLTLNRPWDDTSSSLGGGPYYIFSYVVVGYHQQAFMQGGYKTTAVKYGTQNTNSTVSSGYKTMLPSMSTWMHDIAFDPAVKGTFYASISDMCEPTLTATSSPVFLSIHGATSLNPGCGFSGLLYPPTERTNNVEALPGYIEWYLQNPSPTRQAFVDQVYGAIYGDCSMTKPGFYCDANFIPNSDVLGDLGAGKWPGFFFGQGGYGSHGWPAIRLLISINSRPINGVGIIGPSIAISIKRDFSRMAMAVRIH